MQWPADSETSTDIMHAHIAQTGVMGPSPWEIFAACLCHCKCPGVTLPARLAHARFSDTLQLHGHRLHHPAADVMHSFGYMRNCRENDAAASVRPI